LQHQHNHLQSDKSEGKCLVGGGEVSFLHFCKKRISHHNCLIGKLLINYCS
ncbi:hypothetical protein MKW98_023739, partial [Papaver atlanticum]